MRLPRNREAFDAGAAAQPAWNLKGARRARACSTRRPTCWKPSRADFHELLVREAGKTHVGCHRRGARGRGFLPLLCGAGARRIRGARAARGPTGESNELSLHGRGVFACISPWNFPLAIFAGQVTAALAAGNAVVAKPAEPTPLIAARFVRLLHEAGVPPQALHLVPARGRLFGEVAFAHAALAGVAMTGSTATALTINRSLAARGGAIVP